MSLFYRYLNLFPIILLAFSLVSCLGVIEDKNPEQTKSPDIKSQRIPFNGLVEARAVSDSRVALLFEPAPGDPGTLTYLVTIDQSELPLKILGGSLEVNYEGLYMFTVTNLEPNRNYNFRVGVRNSQGAETNDGVVLSARTFSNLTARFSGVSTGRPAPGIAGRDSVLLEWTPAEIKGTQFTPRATDPVGYEVRFVNASAGGPNLLNVLDHPDVVVLPYLLAPANQASFLRNYTVMGLSSGETYHFQVRAIHKNYMDLGPSRPANYKHEMNTRYVTVTTLDDVSGFSFNPQLSHNSPLGNLGLNRRNINWNPASGGYHHYRVYYMQVGDPDEEFNDVAVNVPDQYPLEVDEPDVLFLYDDTLDYVQVSPGNAFHQLTALVPYSYYQVKVAACGNASCNNNEWIASETQLFRVTPRLVDFYGILDILNPSEITPMGEIVPELTIKFNPPVITSGFMTDLILYCHENELDSNPIAMPMGEVINAPGSPCDGLQRLTPNPGGFTGYASMDQIAIDGITFDVQPGGEVLSDRYCFSVQAVIDTPDFTAGFDRPPIIRCITPEIKVPQETQFPGALAQCDVEDNSIDVIWPAPSAGLFSNYQVFWRDRSESSAPSFSYSDAINGAAGYSSQDLSADDNEFLIENLLPGRRYDFGVLTYVTLDGERIYSEANTGIGSCQMPFPTAAFQEWVDIMAIGPKKNGRIPHWASADHRRYALERLDQFGMPIEVELSEINPPAMFPSDEFQAIFGATRGSAVGTFNGVFGESRYTNWENSFHKYSDQGIVRIAWRDVVLDNGLTMTQAIDAAGEDGVAKNLRTIGYRVFRSDDSRMTWQELTSSEFEFQTNQNNGLVIASNYGERDRANAPLVEQDVVIFTDYSVQALEADGLVERARVYYYKVVPVFDNIEVKFNDEGSALPHNVIRVTLPPPNMALVHRLIANRLTCLELGLEPEEGFQMSNYYTCPYNGVGARGLGAPWQIGETVYDIGGDLLVDRFELGCAFSRGDINNTDVSNVIDDNLRDLPNLPARGCMMHSRSTGNRSIVDLSGDGDFELDFNSIIPGDCFGRDRHSVYRDACDSEVLRTKSFFYPGAFTSNLNPLETGAQNECDEFDYNDTSSLVHPRDFFNINNLEEDFGFHNRQAQSEFAGVYFNSEIFGFLMSDSQQPARHFEASAAQGPDARIRNTGWGTTSCSINLPINKAGDVRARWFSPREIGGRVRLEVDGAWVDGPIDHLTSPLQDILDDPVFYGPGEIPPIPSHIDLNAPLARLMTSNSAKLPPIDGNQTELHRLCSTYQVEVGVLDRNDNYTVMAESKRKNLPRRKEQIASTAWKPSFNESNIIQLERGDFIIEPVNDDDFGPPVTLVNVNTSCYGDVRSLVDPLYDYMNLSAGSPMHSRMPAGTFFSGLSFYDDPRHNTQNCQSRFGIQNQVGNFREWTSDRFFCDYSGESVRIQNNGTNQELTSVELLNDTGNNYSDVFDHITNNLTVFRPPRTDTGACSLVQQGSNQGFQMSTGASMIPSADGLGGINALSAMKGFDPFALDQMRSGNGQLLDFGENSLGPRISFHNTLSLTDPPGTPDTVRQSGIYFNPVIGIPLRCGFAEQCGELHSDNNRITTLSIRQSRNVPDIEIDNFDIPNFPTGNSNIISRGMSMFGITNTDTNAPASGGQHIINVDIDGDNPENNELVWQDDPPEGTPKVIQRVKWDVNRWSPLGFSTGGSRSFAAGRFSLEMRESRTPGVARCSVMINMD